MPALDSTRELRILTETAKALTTALDLPDLLKSVMDRLSYVLDLAEAGVLFLWHESAGILRPAAAFGFVLDELNGMGLQPGEALIGQVYDEGAVRSVTSPEEVSRTLDTLRQANAAILQRALVSRPPLQGMIAAPLQAGGIRFGVLTLMILHDCADYVGAVVPLVQILADLIALAIDRARLETKADSIRAEQQADHLRSEALAMLSHELRTPLTAIMGYSTALLLEDVHWPEEKRREFLHLIEQECNHMQVMISDIADSALLDVGQFVIEREPVRLERLAREVVREIAQQTKIHRFVTDFPDGFPFVNADPHRIRQVLRNILNNAVRYSPDGGLVVIRGQIRQSDIVISISDEGVGISAEDLIPLFEKYFRVKSPNGYYVPGTGLGLPVARTIVEAHGGRIWAESTLGEGTTISFSILREDILEDGLE